MSFSINSVNSLNTPQNKQSLVIEIPNDAKQQLDAAKATAPKKRILDKWKLEQKVQNVSAENMILTPQIHQTSPQPNVIKKQKLKCPSIIKRLKPTTETYNKATQFFVDNKFKESIKYFSVFLKTEYSTAAHYHIGLSHYMEGEHKKAVDHLLIAVDGQWGSAYDKQDVERFKKIAQESLEECQNSEDSDEVFSQVSDTPQNEEEYWDITDYDHVDDVLLKKTNALHKTLLKTEGSGQKESRILIRQLPQISGSQVRDIPVSVAIEEEQAIVDWIDEIENISSSETSESADEYNIGCDYHDESDYEECIPHFKKALDGPMRAPSAYHLGTSYVMLKEYAEAVPYLEIALKEPWDESIDSETREKCLKTTREDLKLCLKKCKIGDTETYVEEEIPERDLADEIRFQKGSFKNKNEFV